MAGILFCDRFITHNLFGGLELSKALMIIAGEASGDLHGASLIKELRGIDKDLRLFGIGGDKMITEGMNADYHIKDMAFLGFVEVIKHLPFIKRVQQDLLKRIAEEKIDTVVLIDYPGFNLSFAKKIKKLGIKIIYYISPQVWAWGKGRIPKIKRLVDKMLVVFPFEKEMYNQHGIDAEYVGHPLVERIDEYKFLTRDGFFEKFSLDKTKELLLIMPGSRIQEIKKIFPESIKAAEKIANEFNMQVVVSCSQHIDSTIFKSISDATNYKLITGNNYDLMKYAKCGIIKSGTSTLEAGLFGLPSVIVYSTNWITYLIGRSLVKIKNIALANIIAGETIFDELIQGDVNSENIFNKIKTLLTDIERYNSVKEKLKVLKTKLGQAGASAKAAQIIYAKLNEA